MRKRIIAGNWKMNLTPKQAKELILELSPKVKHAACEVVVCPPAVDLQAVSEAISGTNIVLGAQNVHWKESGAYTGEISAKMLLELGVKYVIIGHSERRQYFGETDETVNMRALFALESGLAPIICVGESLETRESGTTNEFVSNQIKAALKGMSKEQVKGIVIAYEPIWAIGTGKTATSAEAYEAISAIRSTIADIYDESVANLVRIQYGGSMNSRNASELLAMENIDGGLIGGASLKADDFAAICAAASK